MAKRTYYILAVSNVADSMQATAAVPGTRVPKTKVVASTIEEVESEDNVIAAFAPSASLGNRTDSGGSDNISDLSPLKCKHFIWNCIINGPLSEFPLKVSTLVDNGCHLVLIRPNIVQKLGLPIHTLHTPEPVDVAIKNRKEKQKCILKKFVILSVTSIDQQWSSKRIRAIIAPNLCMPLILGIPFLSHNNIVMDHALRSCVDKKSDYNLINPKIVLSLPPKTLPMTKRKESKKNKKNYLKELKEVCSQ
jgi:Aspartyl protease